MSDTLIKKAERAAEITGSRFTLIGAIVKRAAQLNVGYPPLVTGVETDKHATTALREIAAGAVEVGKRDTLVREQRRAA